MTAIASYNNLERQENNPLDTGTRNRKDDTTSWVLQAGWPALFSGTNIKLIGETRLLTVENRQLWELLRPIDERIPGQSCDFKSSSRNYTNESHYIENETTNRKRGSMYVLSIQIIEIFFLFENIPFDSQFSQVLTAPLMD